MQEYCYSLHLVSCFRLLQKDKNNLEALRMLALHSLCRDGDITEVKHTFLHFFSSVRTLKSILNMLHLWCSCGILTVFISPLAVSKADFKPHQQPGHAGTTQRWAVLQNVSSLHPCCKTIINIILKAPIVIIVKHSCCFCFITVWTKWESYWADIQNGGKSLYCGVRRPRFSHRVRLPDGASGQDEGGNEVVQDHHYQQGEDQCFSFDW